MKKTFDILKERGYVYQTTDEKSIGKQLNEEKLTFYLGIDPTADSLHIGHFFALTMVKRLQKMGHKAIIIIGGATALIGDPSGKTQMRATLSKEEVAYNKKEVRELVKRFVKTTGDNPAIILDNNDWLAEKNYVDFMREIGIHFNVNTMLATECYKNRLNEGGLTFLEMGYMLMQAYDFVYLNEQHDCVLQIGGSDQWANMVAGVELARKIDHNNGNKNRNLQALTCPLLVKSDGEKMGKTAAGTLWVSREKTTVYDFYQMFINVYDEDVERLLSFFSDYEMSEIKKMCQENIIEAKKIMAFEVTKLVHGEDEATAVKEASEKVFGEKHISDNMPEILIEKSEITMIDLLVKSGLASSKTEAKRLILQGGIKINNEKVIDENKIVVLGKNDEIMLQKGKKTIIKVRRS